MTQTWVFSCPLHGRESQVFCWRAYQDENVDLWAKVEIAMVVLETTPEERRQHLIEFKKEAK